MRYYSCEMFDVKLINKLATLVTVLVLLFSFNSFGQGASISGKLDTNVIKLGGQTKLRLSVAFSKGIPIAFPEFKDSIASHVEIVEETKIDTLINKETKVSTLEKIYTITSFDSGYWTIPAIRVYLNNDTAQFLESEALLLEVKGVVVNLEKDVTDIKDPLSMGITLKEILIILGIIVLVIIVVVGLIVYFVFFHKKKKITQLFQPKPLSAHEKALGLLEQLRKKKLWETNQVKLYHSELTDIIRGYIGARFQVSSPEQVSDETLVAMKDKVDEVTFGKLKQILQLADMVKFAKEQPLPNENELSMSNAVDFVNTTRLVEIPLKQEKK